MMDSKQELPRPPEVRLGGDRRSVPTPRLSAYSLFKGRRKNPRREEELDGSYVDVYDTRLLIAILWIALLNVADSFFTIVHLQKGGTEANPFAQLLLDSGRVGFVVGKSCVIGLALLVLCMHKNFRIARIGLWIAAVAYTLLLGYHLLLFWI